TGKWLQNVGALGAYVPGVVLVVLGVWAALSGVPAANSFAVADLVPDFSNLPELNLWASIAFAFAGLELCASMGEEAAEADRSLPRSIYAALPLIAFLYLAGTASVLWLVPHGELNIVSGFLQAIHAGAGDVGVTLVWLAPVAAAMYVIGNLGGVGAWLAGPARVAFVIGLDRYFPPAFGRVHPKWKTPYVAILVQGVLATFFLVLSVLGQGTTVERAYLVLLDTMILIYFIPYLYLFGAYLRLTPAAEGRAPERDGPSPSLKRRAVTGSGLLLTLLAMTMAVIPPAESTAWVFWLKVVGGAGAIVGLGGVLYWRGRRQGGEGGVPGRDGAGGGGPRLRGWCLPLLVAGSLAAVSACGPSGPGSGSAPGEAGDGTRSWNVVRDEAWVPLRDGVRLRATLLSPEGGGPFPCLLHRTPYSREEYEDESTFPVRAARQGFLVALVDVRGRYGSEGSFHAYRQERDDGHDTVEWLAGHPRCDGNVGSWGGSYPGYVQWLALAEEPRGYRTAAPDMTPVGPDHFFHVGGA
ncbi:MAG TPA: CocE/NonD family hydrolase, partial [Longimicrobiales bacterium]|nr:CocE/NonD family hydrolase [Longimicrobiales bacterium]